jgi:hypothetical protein
MNSCPDAFSDILQAIETECAEANRAYPNYEATQILMLIHRSGVAGLGFLKLAGPIVSPLTDWECIGTGQPLASYLVADLYRPTMAMKEVALLAMYALTHVKRHAYGCGGLSQVLRIWNDGTYAPFMSPERPADRHQEQENLEKYVLDMDRAIKPFILNTVSDDLTREEFEHNVEAFNARMRAVGKQRLDWLEAKRKQHDDLMQSILDAEENEEDSKS